MYSSELGGAWKLPRKSNKESNKKSSNKADVINESVKSPEKVDAKNSKTKFSRLEREAKKNREERISIPNELPAIAMRSNMVIFPNTVVPFYVGREGSLMALEEAMERLINSFCG